MAYKSSSLPPEVDGLEDLLSNDIAAIDNLAEESTLWIFGSNPIGDNTLERRSSPVQTIGSATNWKQVAVGVNNTAGIKSDGTLWIWGSNFYGLIADGYAGGSTILDRSSPVQVFGRDASGVQRRSFWKQVAFGYDMVLAIDDEGELFTWGRGAYYQSGQGQGGLNNTVTPQPVQGIVSSVNVFLGKGWKQVTGGPGFAAGAIKMDGSLWVWGRNTGAGFSTPGILGAIENAGLAPFQTVLGGNNWSQIAATYEGFGAIKEDGSLWTWGGGQYGQLGTGNTSNVTTPTQIGSSYDWKQISFSSNYSAHAVKTNGTLWTWGLNNLGQLGLNDTISRSSPTLVPSNIGWKDVKGCHGIKLDNTWWVWGYDGSTFEVRSSPVQIGYLQWQSVGDTSAQQGRYAAIRFKETFEELLG